MESINTILAVLIGILTISNGYLAFRQNKLKLDAQVLENEREIIRKKELEVRDDKLINKIETRLEITRIETEDIKTLLSELKDELTKTNIRIDESNQIQKDHINESQVVRNFLKVYRYTLNQSLHFWDSENEKFKLILSNWGENIEKYALAYIESKTQTISTIDGFNPESKMLLLIEDFYKLTDSLIVETYNAQSFTKWVEAKKVHAKSELLAFDLKRNGLTCDAFNKKFVDYIFEFSTIYTRAVSSWIKLFKSK
jgi:hypothetical protein